MEVLIPPADTLNYIKSFLSFLHCIFVFFFSFLWGGPVFNNIDKFIHTILLKHKVNSHFFLSVPFIRFLSLVKSWGTRVSGLCYASNTCLQDFPAVCFVLEFYYYCVYICMIYVPWLVLEDNSVGLVHSDLLVISWDHWTQVTGFSWRVPLLSEGSCCLCSFLFRIKGLVMYNVC